MEQFSMTYGFREPYQVIGKECKVYGAWYYQSLTINPS